METQDFESKQEANFAFLRDQLKNLGFSQQLDESLHSALKSGEHGFSLPQEGKNKTQDGLDTSYDLHFSRGTTTDLYFLNSFDLNTISPEGMVTTSQQFPVNHNRGITAKEAFNMMEGRAVYKQNLINKAGEKYNSWIQLNPAEQDEKGNLKFKMFHDNYGFDLEKALDGLPVKELADSTSRQWLVKGLQKGNLQSVTWQENGQEEKRLLAANPQFKGIDRYDGNMKKIFVENKRANAGEAMGRGAQQGVSPINEATASQARGR